MKTKKILAIALAVSMAMGFTTVPTIAEEKKTFVFGDTTFNAENEEADINPQNTYAGWACIRYGVGETLFRYSDTMEIEPWIAKEYENVDDLTWKITLNDGVTFSNGRACDGEAVKECLEPAACAKNVTIELSGDSFTVRAAYKHIYELVENIVSNAIKYNKDGGRVEITLHDVGETGCIYVRDNGIGIPKESLNRVFERFYRVDKGRSTKEGSTGLGLSIVKHIVNCYGGTVTLDSELGKGTLVCVRLPIAKNIME